MIRRRSIAPVVAIGTSGYFYSLPRRRGGYFRLYFRNRYIGRRRSLAELLELARVHRSLTAKSSPGPLFDRLTPR